MALVRSSRCLSKWRIQSESLVSFAAVRRAADASTLGPLASASHSPCLASSDTARVLSAACLSPLFSEIRFPAFSSSHVSPGTLQTPNPVGESRLRAWTYAGLPQLRTPAAFAISNGRAPGAEALELSAAARRLYSHAAIKQGLLGDPVTKQLATGVGSPALPVPSPSAGELEGASWRLVPSRSVYVEVLNGNVEKAIKKFKSKLREDNMMRVVKARMRYWKPTELRRLKAKESMIRRRNKDFKEKLDWIMEEKANSS